MLRIDQLAVDPHVEHAAAALLEDGLTACLLLDVRRQTGGAWEVVSDDAVFDLDLHALLDAKGGPVVTLARRATGTVPSAACPRRRASAG
jgi:hypothetical protein